MSTQDILNEREKTHGDYEQFAELWADLNRVIREHTEKYPKYALDSNYPPRTIKHTTSICMILNKIARIICGDPNFADHWDDIAGYAELGKGKAKGAFGAGEPCKHPNKKREYFDDTDDGLQTIMTVDYCHECNKMNIVDCEQKENKITLREWINKHGNDAVQAEIKRINEEIEAQEEAEKSTSSKMEHVPTCDRCGEECETTCFTLKDKRFCSKCAGEIAGEACKMEDDGHDDDSCTKKMAARLHAALNRYR